MRGKMLPSLTTTVSVLLAPGRRSLLMIVSAMEKAAPLSE